MTLTIALPTDDRRRAYAFYRDTLGLTPGEPAEDGVPEPLQFRLTEETVLMLIPRGGFGWVLGAREPADPGVSECLLSRPLDSAADVSALCERMRELGGEVLAEPTRQEWGFTAVVTDPDGHAWQLIAEPELMTD